MHTTTLRNASATMVRVEIEDDATPVVRLIGRTLRDAARLDHATDVLGRGAGTVTVRSHATPQAASVAFADGAVTVTGGVFGPTDATVTVDLDSRFAATATAGDAELAEAILRLLQVPLPDWREAGARFWDVTRAVRGVPDVLVAVATGPDSREEAASERAPRPTAWSVAPTRSPESSPAPISCSPLWNAVWASRAAWPSSRP